MKIFIQSNKFQTLAAGIARYTFVQNADVAPADIQIIDTDKMLSKYEGRYYLRNGHLTQFSLENCQSFTLTRFAVPQLMNYEGQVLVVDPDVFFIGQKTDLAQINLAGAAIACREKTDPIGATSLSSSVMFLDCAKLRSWNFSKMMEDLFAHKIDYYDMMWLKFVPRDTVKVIDETWNDIDHLSSATKMIHYSERITQPWMLGLRFDRYLVRHKGPWNDVKFVLKKVRKLLKPVLYVRNPYPEQEKLFFKIASEALKHDTSLQEEAHTKVKQGLLRHDFFNCLETAR
jgi:hypothetical protein